MVDEKDKKRAISYYRRCGDIPKMTLKMMSPNEVEIAKLRKLYQDTGEVRCKKHLKCVTSSDN